MNRLWLRTAEKLNYVDPTVYLRLLRTSEIKIALSDTQPKVRSLRTNSLKVAREQREAALFCQGMSERLGHKVYFATQENQDYDFIAKWIVGEESHYAVVQLKELVPIETNPQATMETLIKSLAKYTDSKDLTVAIHLNQRCRFEPFLLRLPSLNIASIWVFGCVTPDQSGWSLWGNFTESEPYCTQFAYPEAHF